MDHLTPLAIGQRWRCRGARAASNRTGYSYEITSGPDSTGRWGVRWWHGGEDRYTSALLGEADGDTLVRQAEPEAPEGEVAVRFFVPVTVLQAYMAEAAAGNTASPGQLRRWIMMGERADIEVAHRARLAALETPIPEPKPAPFNPEAIQPGDQLQLPGGRHAPYTVVNTARDRDGYLYAVVQDRDGDLLMEPASAFTPFAAR